MTSSALTIFSGPETIVSLPRPPEPTGRQNGGAAAPSRLCLPIGPTQQERADTAGKGHVKTEILEAGNGVERVEQSTG